MLALCFAPITVIKISFKKCCSIDSKVFPARSLVKMVIVNLIYYYMALNWISSFATKTLLKLSYPTAQKNPQNYFWNEDIALNICKFIITSVRCF